MMSPTPTPSPGRFAALRGHWQALPARERRLVLLAVAVVAAALLWWVALAPALATLREAPQQRRMLDAQLQAMGALQAQARALQSLPRIPRDEAQRALEGSVGPALGAGARLVVSGDNATLSLQAASADALAQWLAQARINARALPAEAHLQRTAQGLWAGSLVLALPAR